MKNKDWTDVLIGIGVVIFVVFVAFATWTGLSAPSYQTKCESLLAMASTSSDTLQVIRIDGRCFNLIQE